MYGSEAQSTASEDKYEEQLDVNDDDDDEDAELARRIASSGGDDSGRVIGGVRVGVGVGADVDAESEGRRKTATITTKRRKSFRGADIKGDEEEQEQQQRRLSVLRRASTVHHRDPVYVWSSLAAGAGSGAVASVICAPLDLVRTRMQVWGDVVGGSSSAGGGRGAAGTIAIVPKMIGDIVRREGYTGCFRGLGATLITVPAFWAVYFPLYNDCKYSWLENNVNNTNPALIHMGSAVYAGAVSDIICNPMFVVRTRLQTESLHKMVEEEQAQQKLKERGGGGASAPSSTTTSAFRKKNSLARTIKLLYLEGGPLVFWRGMTANLLGLSHVAVQFPAYEQLKKTLREMEHRGQDGGGGNIVNRPQHESPLNLLVASALAKMSASLLTYPHEVIRSRMMDARSSSSSSSGDGSATARKKAHGFVRVCTRIYQKEGAAGFYAGLPISLIRVIPNTCITFISYELILRWAKTKIKEHRHRS